MNYRPLGLLLFLFPLLFLWGGLVVCLQRPGFSLAKISSKFSYNSEWESELSSREAFDFLHHEVFSQPYYFVGTGGVHYAFVSRDGRFVIKFFKMQRLLAAARAKNPMLSYERVFANYVEAYKQLSSETALVYLHLNKTHWLNESVSLTDEKGKEYLIDLDRFEFVVQERASRLYDHLTRLTREGRMDEAREGVRAFFDLISTRSKKGFSNHGLSLKNNFGFCHGRVIQIDCTTLVRDDAMKYPHNFKQEVTQIAERLNQWAQCANPDLCIYIQEEAQRVINAYE